MANMDSECLELLLQRMALKSLENTTFYSNLTKELDEQIAFCKNLLTGMVEELEVAETAEHTRRTIYAYITPFIIAFGLVGNMLSLSVFLMKNIRRLSASIYLGVLAMSDSMVLLSYALFEWLFKGLPEWPGGYSINAIGVEGVCQTYLFVSYVFRFFSAYVITAFTVERYVGVCKPLHRRRICTNSFARKSICGLFIISCLVSLYKPILSTVHQMDNGSSICGKKKEHERLNFALDTVYASLITGVSIVVILSLNVLIIGKFWATRRRHKAAGFRGDDSNSSSSIIKVQFTVIILLVSSTFVVLNLPYAVMWCLTYVTDVDRGVEITKTVFLCNYSCNFLLYSFTGAYFRKQLRKRLSCFGWVCGWVLPLPRGRESGAEERNLQEQSVVLTGCTVVHDVTNMAPSSGTVLEFGGKKKSILQSIV